MNYERVVFDQVAVRVGFSPRLWGDSGPRFVAPITIAYVGLRWFEAGGGVTFVSEREPYATTLVGFRLHPRGGGGFQFRAGGMLLAGENVWHAGIVAPWMYLSAGVGF